MSGSADGGVVTSPQVHSGERDLDYAQLRARAARIAGGLRALGVGSGDRVAIVLRNEPAFLEVSIAAALVGAVPVPTNWHWKGEELGYVLSNSASKVVFVHSDLLAQVEPALPAETTEVLEVALPVELVQAYGMSQEAAAPSGRHPLLDSWLAEHEPLDERAAAPPMSVIYTSGTTGRPKAILRSTPSPDMTAKLLAGVMEVFGLAPGMRTLVPAPLYHTAPNIHATFAAALELDLTLMPRFDAEQLLALVQAKGIQHIQMVPTMFVRLLALPQPIRSRYDLSSLRAVVHAAAPCPVHVKQAMIDWLGPIVREYYGGSEVGPIVSCDSAGWLAHPGTVGRPIEGADVRVHAPDGELLAAGQVGEIYLKPPPYWPQFTYLGDEEKRRSIERDGYLTLGDVGYLDEDGYLFLTDRASDMVISGGVNIYPAEIEAVLHTLPGVRDVAVFGIPDERYGEALAAHIDAAPEAGLTEEAVRDHVRRELAGYKVPKVVVFDDELPREDSGKLFKRRLRDRYWAQTNRRI
jgi:long-chain acyl-CoA synthetase